MSALISRILEAKLKTTDTNDNQIKHEDLVKGAHFDLTDHKSNGDFGSGHMQVLSVRKHDTLSNASRFNSGTTVKVKCTGHPDLPDHVGSYDASELVGMHHKPKTD